MTKKDYELIATTIRDALEYAPNIMSILNIETLAKVLCGRLSIRDPKFDQDKFLATCGLKD